MACRRLRSRRNVAIKGKCVGEQQSVSDELERTGLWRCTGSDDIASRSRLNRQVLTAESQVSTGRAARLPRFRSVAGMQHNAVDPSWRDPGFPQTDRDPLAYSSAPIGLTEFPG